jgi:hypothetical protein
MAALAILACLVTPAVADDNRIHPVCDDTKTPRCWVPHPDQPSRLVPVNKPAAAQAPAPQPTQPRPQPQSDPDQQWISPIARTPAQLPPGDPYGHQRGYGRPLMFRFGPLLLLVR